MASGGTTGKLHECLDTLGCLGVRPDLRRLVERLLAVGRADHADRDAIRAAAEAAAGDAVGFMVTFQWKAMDDGLSDSEREGLCVLRA